MDSLELKKKKSDKVMEVWSWRKNKAEKRKQSMLDWEQFSLDALSVKEEKIECQKRKMTCSLSEKKNGARANPIIEISFFLIQRNREYI